MHVVLNLTTIKTYIVIDLIEVYLAPAKPDRLAGMYKAKLFIYPWQTLNGYA